MAELITIPVSVFDTTIDYARPAIPIWSEKRATIVQTIFESLNPWNPNVDDIEIRTAGKLSEQGINFKLPLKRASFFFGPASCTFTQDSVSWETAEETLKILSAALNALVESSGIRLSTRRTAISLHIQPRTTRFVDLIKPFVPPQLAALESEAILTMASVVKWEDRKITIDGSGVIANAVYLKFERDFDAGIAFEEIVHQLKKDEEVLFGILGVQEDVG
jgi:hypothetical protein